tara:strand:- start:2332 stop:2541 length:210 start_codon:yes stop_codon:yes gene_type:complete
VYWNKQFGRYLCFLSSLFPNFNKLNICGIADMTGTSEFSIKLLAEIIPLPKGRAIIKIKIVLYLILINY